MRKSLLLVLISVIALRTYTQSLLPSTIGEVFNYEVGDSFVYLLMDTSHECEWAYYSEIYSHIITQKYYSASFDTVFYSLNSYHNGIVDTSLAYLNITNLDGDIFNFDWPYGSSGSDKSVFIDSNMHHRKGDGRDYSESSQIQQNIYHDGLGMTFEYYMNKLTFDRFSISLIYYHKANGETWPPTLSEFTDIGRITLPVATIIFPNPTQGVFQLELSARPHPATTLNLFDARGCKVRQEPITNILTVLRRENLVNGVYFWQVESEGRILDRGKIIFQ